jgi:enoyl-CoA hydratase/carnithine racemase
VNKSVAAAGPADATNSPTEHLESLDQGAISALTLDDPKRANAMSREMGDAFTSRVRAIQDDPALRVVIIRGAGRDFSIGGHRGRTFRARNTAAAWPTICRITTSDPMFPMALLAAAN